MTNDEKILSLVLQNIDLRDSFDIDPANYTTIDSAINSNNIVVSTIGKIIRKSKSKDLVQRDLYTELYNYLKENYNGYKEN